MKKNLLLLFSLLTLFISGLSAQKIPDAYLLFDGEGKEVKWDKMMHELLKADVIFFGELHNDPVVHWLQNRLMKDIHLGKKENFIMGAEMFETDQQLILDEYLSLLIDDTRFEEGTRLWSNYKTDYKPLLKYARDSSITFIATNIPRRYANMVSKSGFDALSSLKPAARELMAPLPFRYDPSVPAYAGMLEMSMGHGMSNENLPRAQAAKDATMAWFISENLEKGKCFLHFNGAYHSDFHDGIIWHLMAYRPEVKIITISSVLQDKLEKLDEENLGRADFIFVIPSDMTRTY